MNAKIKKGSDFKGVLKYALKKSEAKLLQHNLNAVNETPLKLALEFKSIADLRPGCEKPVFHCSLTLPRDEKLSDEKWCEIADSFLHKMGFENAPRAVIRHHDTDHDHIHIISSRVNFDGDLIRDSFDKWKANAVCENLEVDFSLKKTNHHKKPGVSVSEKIIGEKEKTHAFFIEDKKALAEKIDSSVENYLDFAAQTSGKFNFSASKFSYFCQKNGVRVDFNKKNGSIRGCSFSSVSNERKGISGGKLRRDFTLGNIKRRFSHSEVQVLRTTKKNETMEKLIKDMTKFATKTVATKYGFKMKIGNQTAVVIDSRDSFKIKGIADEKTRALLAAKVANDRGWTDFKITGVSQSTRDYIDQIKKGAVDASEKEKNDLEAPKITVSDVLRSKSSLDDFKQNQKDKKSKQSQQKTNKKGVTR